VATGTSKRRGPTSKPKQRRPSAQRPSQAQAHVAPGVEPVGPAAAALPASPRVSSRSKRASLAAARVTPLPRSVEYAYIRDDLRRLAIIATALLALMLVILLLVNR
jgi:hypothetical protein